MKEGQSFNKIPLLVQYLTFKVFVQPQVLLIHQISYKNGLFRNETTLCSLPNANYNNP